MSRRPASATSLSVLKRPTQGWLADSSSNATMQALAQRSSFPPGPHGYELFIVVQGHGGCRRMCRGRKERRALFLQHQLVCALQKTVVGR